MTTRLWDLLAHFLSWDGMRWPVTRSGRLYALFLQATIRAGWADPWDWWWGITMAKGQRSIRLTH